MRASLNDHSDYVVDGSEWPDGSGWMSTAGEYQSYGRPAALSRRFPSIDSGLGPSPMEHSLSWMSSHSLLPKLNVSCSSLGLPSSPYPSDACSAAPPPLPPKSRHIRNQLNAIQKSYSGIRQLALTSPSVSPSSSLRKVPRNRPPSQPEYWKTPPPPWVSTPEPKRVAAYYRPEEEEEECQRVTPSAVVYEPRPCPTCSPLQEMSSSDSSWCWMPHLDLTSSPEAMMEDDCYITKEVDVDEADSHLPGLGSKKRRCLFMEELRQLEDAVAAVARDADLLDRAERRDLPTLHQLTWSQQRQDRKSASSGTSSSSSDSPDSDEKSFTTGWTTSSSFERQAARVRAPPSRRSAVFDRHQDDMLHRLCRDQQRSYSMMMPGDPAAKSLSSMSSLSQPAWSVQPRAQSLHAEALFCPDQEADPWLDDIRRRCHSQALNCPRTREEELPFGLPISTQNLVDHGRQDYLHIQPDPNRRRSTFCASLRADRVRDDLAFRMLRKDTRTQDDPHQLGLTRHPQQQPVHSCWSHRIHQRSWSPDVFYPDKNNRTAFRVAVAARNKILQQSHEPEAGDPSHVISYEEYLRASRGALPTTSGSGHREQDWRGKTLFQLLSGSLDSERGQSAGRMDDKDRDLNHAKAAHDNAGWLGIPHDVSTSSSLRDMERHDSLAKASSATAASPAIPPRQPRRSTAGLVDQPTLDVFQASCIDSKFRGEVTCQGLEHLALLFLLLYVAQTADGFLILLLTLVCTVTLWFL